MKSTILQTSTRYLHPILLLFSVFLLIRGHYLPGGGFVGGLVASISFVLHSIAYGTRSSLKILHFQPLTFMTAGLGVAALSMFFPVLLGYPVMTGMGLDQSIPVVGLVGTALFFDIGVYLVVIGVVLTILFTISLETH